MKTFKNQAAQGDLLIRRIQELPIDIKKISVVDGVYIVAHSETGHHHVIEENSFVHLYAENDPMVSYLQVLESCDEVEVILKHLRSHDTHESIKIPTGIFELRRQREYIPEGWRMVND